MKNKKTIWIVNEYNFPDDVKTRQTILCNLLNQKGYDCFLISGSYAYKDGNQKIKGKGLIYTIPVNYIEGLDE